METSLIDFYGNMKEQTKESLLIVEDSEHDIETFFRVVKQISFPYSIYHCFDGDEALDFLYNQGKYQDREKSTIPSLILLDLNLPGTDGREVLEKIKQDDSLKTIPVVIFTTSSNPKDIQSCYEKGANTYVLKPMDINKLKETIEILVFHWFKISILPNHG